MKGLNLILAVGACIAPLVTTAQKYQPTLESLSQHTPAPEWLKDAKLGIYFHWGVYSVPAYKSEWYPRLMFLDPNVREYHTKTYGDPAEFGYEKFVPMFTGEHFDPEDWAELFHQAGARFAGPVAEHHDGFAMWDSKLTPWNSKDMGPRRDILGELFVSLRKRDMRTIATFHHERNLQRFKDTWETEPKFSSSHFPYNPKWPTAAEDERRFLYGNMPEGEWLETMWLGKLKEVIDNYQPDIIWFDSWLDCIPETYRYQFSAYYLNAAEQWNKDVAIVRKQEDLPLAFSIHDHEKSREANALPNLWMSDDTISTGSWCYTQTMTIKPLVKVLHALIDIVSKNGVLLLNLSPMADGTIPANQREVLLQLGDWLKVNGEAIYDTRPWKVAAEGPTVGPEASLKNNKQFLELKYTAQDIRYTAAKDAKTVYAILLGAPDSPSIRMSGVTEKDRVKNVSILAGQNVKWSADATGLNAELSEIKAGSLTTVLKIELE